MKNGVKMVVNPIAILAVNAYLYSTTNLKNNSEL